MADVIKTKDRDGSNLDLASKDIGGVQHPRNLLVDTSGADITPLTDVQLRATAVPVSDTKLPDLLTTTPDSRVSAPPVRLVGQDTITVSFIKSGSGLLTTQMTQRRLGTGMAVSQASGALVLTTGTTTNSEFLARSNETFRGSHIASFRSFLSQRIANNNFVFLVADKVGEDLSCTINSATSITVSLPGHSFDSGDVGQKMFCGAITGAAGVPGYYAIASVVAGTSITLTVAGWPASGSCTLDLFGYNHTKVLYNGTTATSALFDSARKGWPSGDTTITTNTSVSPGHLIQIQNDGRNLFVSDALTASATTPNVTTRGSRMEAIPDDNTDLYVYLWAYNGATAPASTTTWTVGMWDVEVFPNMPVFIAGQRMQGTQAPQATLITNTVNVGALPAGTNAIGDVGVQYRASATGGASFVSVLSPATPVATVCKAAAGRLLGWQLHNSSAALRSVKFWNTAQGSVTLGTTAALFEIDIPAGGRSEFRLEGGAGFATAITYAVTGAKGLTDNTGSLAANDVSGSLFYA